jgi:hypothetical protein
MKSVPEADISESVRLPLVLHRFVNDERALSRQTLQDFY